MSKTACTRARYHRRRDQNICVTDGCGRPVFKEFVRCFRHLREAAEDQTKQRAKRKARDVSNQEAP